MDHNQPIQTFSEDELEQLTQLPVRTIQRARARAIVFHEAQRILDQRVFIETVNQYIFSPGYLDGMEEGLRYQWSILLDVVVKLRSEEEEDQQMLGLWQD